MEAQHLVISMTKMLTVLFNILLQFLIHIGTQVPLEDDQVRLSNVHVCSLQACMDDGRRQHVTA